MTWPAQSGARVKHCKRTGCAVEESPSFGWRGSCATASPALPCGSRHKPRCARHPTEATPRQGRPPELQRKASLQPVPCSNATMSGKRKDTRWREEANTEEETMNDVK